MTIPGPTGGPVPGEVVAYDAESGLGEVRLGDSRTLGFHATELADGSRDVAVGTRVTVVVVAGRAGRLEASRIQPSGRGGADDAAC